MAKRRFWLPFGAPKLDALLWTTYTGWLTQTNPTYCVQRCAYSVARVYCEVCMCASHSVVSKSLRPHGLQATRLLRPWDFPGKSTGVGCHCLLREEDSQMALIQINRVATYFPVDQWTLNQSRESGKRWDAPEPSHRPLLVQSQVYFTSNQN